MRKTLLLKLFALLLVCVLGMQSTALANLADHTSTTAYGKEIELEELRTTDSKTYQLSDGSFQYVGYADDVHYKDSNGKFAEIDNSITNSAEKDGYAYTNTANSWRAYFSNQLSTSKAVLLEMGDYSLSFSMPSASQQGTAKKSVDMADPADSYYGDKKSDNRAVVYQEVLTGVDVVYTVKTSGIKEDIVLKNSAAPHSFEFALTADELMAVERDDTIYFQDRAGNDIFHIGSLYMIDANGKYSESVTCSIHQVKNGYSFVISASEEFLNAEDTVYPVIIDPSIMVTGSSDTFDTCVDEQYPSSNYYSSENLWTGGATGTNTMRTYIKFTMPSNITASQVTSATLRIKKREHQTPTIKAYRVTSNWSSSSVTWNNKPSYTTTNGTGTITLDTGSWYKLDTTTLVKYWLAGTYSNYGFLLKEPSETNSSQKTKFYSSDAPSPNKPELIIEYNNPSSSYTITYNGNGNTGGMPPSSQTVIGGTNVALRTNTGLLTKQNYEFSGWNTNSSGTGVTYSPGQTITMPNNNLTLYAKWVPFNYKIGIEAVSDYSNISGLGSLNTSIDCVRGLSDKILDASSSWTRKYFYTNDSVWENDFKSTTLGGNDSNITDSVDLAAYCGHGYEIQGFVLANQSHDDGFVSRSDLRLGDVNLNWFLTFTCNFLKSEKDDIGIAMNGLHMLCGYKTNMTVTANGGSTFASYATDSAQPIRIAWKNYGVATQPILTFNKISSFYHNSCGNDHLWGFGVVADDPSPYSVTTANDYVYYDYRLT